LSYSPKNENNYSILLKFSQLFLEAIL